MSEYVIAASTAMEMLKLHRLEINDLEDQIELITERNKKLQTQLNNVVAERDELLEILATDRTNRPFIVYE